MNSHYVPALVANRLINALDRRAWGIAEEAADELAELCDGDLSRCTDYINRGWPGGSAARRGTGARVEREVRLACDRYSTDGI